MKDQPTSPANFVHLHVHTQYSLLDGAIRIDDLLEKCKEFGMESVAITDHGAMYGALEFYLKAKKAGIKPIIGCEFYIAPHSRTDKTAKSSGKAAFHIVLLAMNYEGYKNLLKLASIAQLQGFHYKPRIDKETLKEHSQGLIAMTACLHGEIPYLLAKANNKELALKKAQELHDIFPGRLYLEIQENGIAEQTIANDGLKEISKKLDIPLVATNDCHYLNQDESTAHELLLCIQTGKTINDPKRFKFSTDKLYFKSSEQMASDFSNCPEALKTSLDIAERCDLNLEFDKHYFPVFPVPDGETLDSLFEETARQGFKDRLMHIREKGPLSSEQEKIYKDRLDMEINVIKTMGFPGYFLIVADFITWAKDHAIPVGPGRGSGAGSLVAYSMMITDIDPIPYGLIFERFLNVERMSMPDFDIDFCQERRGEVIKYVHDKYGGDDHVAQIVTYGSMKAKGVIRDVGRALAMPFGDVDRIAKLIPDELKMTIKKAIEQEPRLKDLQKRDESVRKLLKIAMVLEGLQRHTSIHAAGVVISPEPMFEYLPVCKGPKGEVLTQYDMKHTEKTGLIKFDFLGLKTLTVIDRSLKLINQELSQPLDIDNIPMNDPKTYDMLCKGDALGVFQLESSGMRGLLMKMKPEVFSDLIALVALYRPGPLDSGMVDDFVDTKHGRKVAKYLLPQLEPILEETYGVIVYQEQVMKIANVLAGYSLGDADNLRRAMGKKIPEVMEEQREKFMEGAEKKDIPADKAKKIFDLMAKFAGYGFNKSHSAAYALIAYQTAYLKAHYPSQFMAALLSCDMNNTDKVVLYINECKDHTIDVLPPDINESDDDFTVINDRIRFGLAAVKNVGGAALDSIIEEREKDGSYKSLGDFCNRVDSRKVNRRVIESLIKAGAFDSLNTKRSQLIAILDQAMEQAQASQRDKESGQLSLFSLMPEETQEKSSTIPMPDIPEWNKKERLLYEKETVGFYITGHPLDDCRNELEQVVQSSISGLGECGDGTAVRIGGLIKTSKELKSKKGDSMAFLTVEDTTGSVEVIAFPQIFAACHHLLNDDNALVIQGVLQKEEEGGAKLLADQIDILSDAWIKYTSSAKIELISDQVSRPKLEAVKKIIHQNHGPCPVSLTIHFAQKGEADVDIPEDLTITPGRQFSENIDKAMGYGAVNYTMQKPEMANRQNRNNFKK
jgi:DNA polymerase III subunit alpha